MHHAVKVHMSVDQMKKLKKGGSIRVAANKMDGPHHVLLTNEQHKKYLKAKKAGKGMTMKMHSQGQIHGSGFWSTLKSIASVAAPVIGNLVGQPALGSAIGQLASGAGLYGPR